MIAPQTEFASKSTKESQRKATKGRRSGQGHKANGVLWSKPSASCLSWGQLAGYLGSEGGNGDENAVSGGPKVLPSSPGEETESM